MKLNLNLCKEYHLGLGKLIATESGNEYEIYLEDSDRFYIYMKQHIINGKVDNMTEVRIDELFITDPEETFFEEKTFILDTKIFVVTHQDMVDIEYVYDLRIRGVSIVDVDLFKRKYENGEWSLPMCALKIPHNTAITVSEISD